MSAPSEMMNVIKIDAHDAQDFVRFIAGRFDNRLYGLILFKQISDDTPETNLWCRVARRTSRWLATPWAYPRQVALRGSVDLNDHEHLMRLLLSQHGLPVASLSLAVIDTVRVSATTGDDC